MSEHKRQTEIAEQEHADEDDRVELDREIEERQGGTDEDDRDEIDRELDEK